MKTKAKYDALPPVPPRAPVEATREAGQYQRKLNNDNLARIVADLKKAGVSVVEQVDGGPVLEATKPGSETFVTKFGGAHIIKAIDAVRDAKQVRRHDAALTQRFNVAPWLGSRSSLDRRRNQFFG